MCAFVQNQVIRMEEEAEVPRPKIALAGTGPATTTAVALVPSTDGTDTTTRRIAHSPNAQDPRKVTGDIVYRYRAVVSSHWCAAIPHMHTRDTSLLSLMFMSSVKVPTASSRSRAERATCTSLLSSCR